ncbi:hypothetical protein ACI2KR_10100 [Pseudomonas luteola]|uniref:hypothetical protein n=1 Tax=Pseudomonas sp. LTJR-52 TaxID=2479392 RepID=UPI0003FF3E78|nr:hypothetical protein [Pseudomonas sp. LTJR-52]
MPDVCDLFGINHLHALILPPEQRIVRDSRILSESACCAADHQGEAHADISQDPPVDT